MPSFTIGSNCSAQGYVLTFPNELTLHLNPGQSLDVGTADHLRGLDPDVAGVEFISPTSVGCRLSVDPQGRFQVTPYTDNICFRKIVNGVPQYVPLDGPPDFSMIEAVGTFLHIGGLHIKITAIDQGVAPGLRIAIVNHEHSALIRRVRKMIASAAEGSENPDDSIEVVLEKDNYKRGCAGQWSPWTTVIAMIHPETKKNIFCSNSFSNSDNFAFAQIRKQLPDVIEIHLKLVNPSSDKMNELLHYQLSGTSPNPLYSNYAQEVARVLAQKLGYQWVV